METLYDRIKRLRIKKGLSQDELARLVGYSSRSTINKIESGLIDISQKKITAFANALSTTPRYLMDGDCPLLQESFNDKEVEMIKKYRQLTTAGKAAVDAVLDSQYEFVKPKLLEDTEIS